MYSTFVCDTIFYKRQKELLSMQSMVSLCTFYDGTGGLPMNPSIQKIPAVLLLILCLSLLTSPARAEEDAAAEPLQKQPGAAFVSQENIIFGQQQVSPRVSSDTNDSQPRITYKIQGASDDTYREDVPTAVGVYTVRVQYPESETSLAAEDTADFTILAYITSIAMEMPPKDEPLTYDGELQWVEELTPVFQVEGTAQLPQPGLDYRLEARLLSPKVDRDPESKNLQAELMMEEGLYALAPEAETAFFFHMDVAPAPLTIRAVDQNAADGFLSDPDLTEIQGLLPGQALKGLDLKLEKGKILPENPQIFAGDQNVTDQYEIRLLPGTYADRAVLRDYPLAAEDLIYNGRDQALLKASGSAETGSVIYELRYHASQSRQEELLSPWSKELPQGREPGIYTVNFKASREGLSDSDQKSLVVLQPRPLTIHAEGHKVYDGRKELPEGNVTVILEEDQILPGEEVRVKTISDSSFQQVGVGENLKIIPGNVVLEGKDAEKYAVKVASFTGTIARRPVTIQADNQEKAYGQKDPEFTYGVQGLAGHEILRGSPDRAPGQDAGPSEILQGTLTEEENPNYSIRFLPGTLTVHPASQSFTLESSRTRIRPGKTVRLTVKARNTEENLMEASWNQPAALSLVYGQRLLNMEQESAGVWTAEYAVPREEKGSLHFTAVSKDPNYRQAGDSVEVKLSILGNNPDTGDRIRFWTTLLFMTALLLAGILIYKFGIHRKK